MDLACLAPKGVGRKKGGTLGGTGWNSCLIRALIWIPRASLQCFQWREHLNKDCKEYTLSLPLVCDGRIDSFERRLLSGPVLVFRTFTCNMG